MKLEIDDLERRTIERSLAERRSHLIEKVEDTTLTPPGGKGAYHLKPKDALRAKHPSRDIAASRAA